MKKTSLATITVFGIALLPIAPTPFAHARAAQEHAQDHDQGHAHDAAGAVHDDALIRAIIADIEAGWENADGEPFERHYLDFPGARYVESGGQNEGLRDLVDNHVVPEGDALSNLELNITDVEVHFEGGFAWAVGDVEVRATIASSGDELHRTGYETFLFRWVDGAWKVVHTHSSTRAPRR